MLYVCSLDVKSTMLMLAEVDVEGRIGKLILVQKSGSLIAFRTVFFLYCLWTEECLFMVQCIAFVDVYSL